jgi:hypothetical protein
MLNSFNGGKVDPPRIGVDSTIPASFLSNIQRVAQATTQWVFRLGGLITYEKPITEFPADQTFAGPITVALVAGIGLPKYCTGFRMVGVTGVTTISINGGGNRATFTGDVITGADIKNVAINVTAGSATIQPWGVGD